MPFNFRLFILFSFLTFPIAAAQAQTPAPTPTTTNPAEGNLYKFESTTVWGHVKVSVLTASDGFQVGVSSDSAVSGWVLKDEKSSQVLSKGGLNPSNQFRFKAGRPFQDAYRLTLYLTSDREQVPVVVRLVATNDGVASKNVAVSIDGLEDFQDNPDRPYNTMVKNLYGQAVESYSKGDNLHALSLLKKAEELDPLQPQVEALLEKIQGPGDKPTSPLDQVRADMKKGKMEEAQAKLEDYLDEHPDDEDALALKDKLEGKHHKKNAPKTKKPAVEKTPPPQNMEDSQAKADQAYNLGLDSYRQGDYAAAKKFWEETLEIQPTHLQAQRNLERLKQEHPDLK